MTAEREPGGCGVCLHFRATDAQCFVGWDPRPAWSERPRQSAGPRSQSAPAGRAEDRDRASSTAGAAEARTPPPALCALPRGRCAHGTRPLRKLALYLAEPVGESIGIGECSPKVIDPSVEANFRPHDSLAID